MTQNNRYQIFELRDDVKRLAKLDDPVSVLRNAASEEFNEASMDELLEAAHREAREQTDEHVR